jgi:hypothetical protein
LSLLVVISNRDGFSLVASAREARMEVNRQRRRALSPAAAHRQ